MSDQDTREAADDDNWVTVGARPRQKDAPPPPHTHTSRKKRPDHPTAARRFEPRENDWHLVMRSRQALTKLRDEDFALTRLGQVHAGVPRRPDPRPANRSRLGARFPTNMASDRPNGTAAGPRRQVRLAMPKFDVPLRSDTDFPSLRGEAKPAASPAAGSEKRRSSVALMLDESLRSMAGAAAQQSESGSAPAPVVPPPIRASAYSEALSWRARPARKSERRDLVRGDIREDVAMLQTTNAPKSPVEPPPAAANTCTGSATSGDSPQKKKEKERRLLKKAKRKESELILARLNASKDTHVQLVTADAFERLHGAHPGRWRRSQAGIVDLRAADQYPSLEETAAAAAAQMSPQEDNVAQPEPLPPERREGGGLKTYSRMLRELPKTLSPPMEFSELVEAKEAKRKAPKKRAPIETSIMDLAEQMPTSRTRRVEVARDLERTPPRRAVPLARLIGNRLDSTAVVQKRGKVRLKKKKPSMLKRIILRERAERRRQAGLLAGCLAVTEQRGDGDALQVKREAAEIRPDQAVEPSAAPAQPPPATHATVPQSAAAAAAVVKHNTTPLKQDAVASQKRVCAPTVQSVPSGGTQQTRPVPVQNCILMKQEPLSTTAANNATSETKSIAGLATGSTQQTTLDIKQEIPSKEPDKKVMSTATPVGDTIEPGCTAPTATDGGDSDSDAPPCRGPDYTPCISVDPKLLIHSRKFRDYCEQTLSPDIDESARHLLQDLARFQDRLYNRDPIKARSRRRLVFGLREVSKHLAIKKLACVILAPNIEKIETAGGLDQQVQRLLTLASEREVPLVFALKRRKLGHACKKPVPVSCVGIFNYQGSEDNYKRMMQLAEAAQERYRAIVSDVEQALQPPTPQLSPAEQLLGAIDSVSGQQPPPPPISEGAADDPTHALLAKLRAVTLGTQVTG